LERTRVIEGMSDREIRARAAEIRMATSKGSLEGCAFCSKPLTMIPFERLTYKYCSMDCLKNHKAKIKQ